LIPSTTSTAGTVHPDRTPRERHLEAALPWPLMIQVGRGSLASDGPLGHRSARTPAVSVGESAGRPLGIVLPLRERPGREVGAVGVAEGGDRVPDPPNSGFDLCQQHVVRVPSRERAQEACVDLAALGYQASAKPAEHSTEWLVIAYRWITRDQFGDVYDELSSVARRADGKWEDSQIAAIR